MNLRIKPPTEPEPIYRVDIYTADTDTLPTLTGYALKLTEAKDRATALAVQAINSGRVRPVLRIFIVRLRGFAHDKPCRWEARHDGSALTWRPVKVWDRWHGTPAMF